MNQTECDIPRKNHYVELFQFYLLVEASGYEEGALLTLPDELLDIFYRLYEEPKSLPSSKLSINFAKIMRQLIYNPIALKPGRDMIYEHMWQLVGIGKASENSRVFEENFQKAFAWKLIFQKKKIDLSFNKFL